MDFLTPRFYTTLCQSLKGDATVYKEVKTSMFLVAFCFLIGLIILSVLLLGHVSESKTELGIAGLGFILGGVGFIYYTLKQLAPVIVKVREEMKYRRLGTSPDHRPRARARRRSGTRVYFGNRTSVEDELVPGLSLIGDGTISIEMDLDEEEGPPGYATAAERHPPPGYATAAERPPPGYATAAERYPSRNRSNI